MPLPLKPGYHFNYARITRPAFFEMASAEAYTDFYGISFMLKGERLVYSPEFTTIVSAGELVFIPKNVYFRSSYVSDQADHSYEHLLIKFTDSMIAELLENIGESTYQELCARHLRFCAETRQKITQIFQAIETEWARYDEHSELILKGLLNTLIITCIRERTPGTPHQRTLGAQQRYISDACIYIQTHIRENPSLETTAAYLNISASYLSKLFVTHLHTPYSNFVLSEKIAQASRLLSDTKLSMTEIAYQSGFSSSSYFSDCFRRIIGLSPLQFRQKSRE